MNRVIEQDILEFIRPGGKKNWILLCESRQEFIQVVVIYET